MMQSDTASHAPVSCPCSCCMHMFVSCSFMMKLTPIPVLQLHQHQAQLCRCSEPISKSQPGLAPLKTQQQQPLPASSAAQANAFAFRRCQRQLVVTWRSHAANESVGIARWICETKTNQNDDSGCPKPPTAGSSPRTPDRTPARRPQGVDRRCPIRLQREYKHHRLHLFPVTGHSLNPELPGRP